MLWIVIHSYNLLELEGNLMGGIMDYIVLIGISIWIMYSDFKEQIIPNVANILLLLYGIIIHYPDLATPLKGVAAGVALMLLVSIAGPIGGGDIKLMSVLGAWFGLQIIDVFLLSYIVGLGFAVIYYLKHKNFKQEIPFGPSIVLAAIIIYTTDISLIYESIQYFLGW